MNDKTKIGELLRDPNYGIPQARGVMSRLFRIILKDLNIQLPSWNTLMENYLDDPANHIPRSGKERSNERGNMMKQLCGDSMTIRTFLKGLSLLGAVKLTFNIQITRRNKKTTTHTVHLVFSEDPNVNINNEVDDEDAVREGEIGVQPKGMPMEGRSILDGFKQD